MSGGRSVDRGHLPHRRRLFTGDGTVGAALEGGAVVEFRALGDLQVVEDGQPLVLGPDQQRAVLALLVLSAGEIVSSDRLIEALWGERPPPTAAKTVQVYISRLRKTLNGAPASSSGGFDRHRRS